MHICRYLALIMKTLKKLGAAGQKNKLLTKIQN
jgi:hypothetical protein